MGAHGVASLWRAGNGVVRMPRPCAPDEAVASAIAFAHMESLSKEPLPYWLGGGNYRAAHPLSPATTSIRGVDCIGWICWAYKLPRKRIGFNHGRWATVNDYVNTDSLIQDAEHERDLVDEVFIPRIGDLLVWPSIYAGELASPRRRAGTRRRIGHIAIVTNVPSLWLPQKPAFEQLTVSQCGSRHTPAIHISTGAAWANKDRTQWGQRPEWRSRILRFL